MLTRDLIREKLITFIRDGARMERNEIVTVEAALTVFVNGTELVTLLCTPADMDRWHSVFYVRRFRPLMTAIAAPAGGARHRGD